MALTINPTIVNLTAEVTPAPAPSQLQQSGAVISVHATTSLATSAYQYYSTESAALAALSSSTGNYLEVTKMIQTFFAQSSASNSSIGVSILELGNQTTPALAITALGAWLASNPNVFYALLTPATWDTTTSLNLNTVASNYSSPTSKTYLFGTTTQAHLTNYQATNKALFMTVNSPSAGGSEFQAAAPFYQWLVNDPGNPNPAAPMAYRFLYGVTPWSLVNNQTAIDTILSDYGNIVYPCAEGGISNAGLWQGRTIDGNQSMFWYAVDWVQIQCKLQLANAIINAANSASPILYNQAGINQLKAIIDDILNDGVTNGLLLGAPYSFSMAQSFASYTTANPANYAAGIYKGFSVTITPQTGFLSITVNIDATSFA
jgi:hypothetical protein